MKYIIDLPDNCSWVQWIMTSDKDGHAYFDFKNPEDLTPLNKELEEAYQQGKHDAEQDLARAAYKEAYQKGFEAGSHEATTIEYQKGFDDAKRISEEVCQLEYNKGLNDAWDAARRIVVDSQSGGYTYEQLEEMFGTRNTHKILCNMTPSEVIAKLKAYEEQQKADEIKVGDEIAFHNEDRPDTVVVVTRVGENGFVDGMDGKGTLYAEKNPKNWTKTGRHFPQAAELLEAMKEGAE